VAKDFFSNHRTNTIIIGVLILLFISVIYFPKTVWDDEVALRDDARYRMNSITQAEKLFYILSRSYTNDLDLLHDMVNDVRDSVRLAAEDTNFTYAGYQNYIVPGRSVDVNYTEAYKEAYLKAHQELLAELSPNHYMPPEQISVLLDTIATLYEAGGYTGPQTIELDSLTSISFTVPDRYDIIYQNIKTLMFNALTGSFTPYADFANPLVDAVLDSIEKDPMLSGRIDFTGIYTEQVTIDFIIPFDYEKRKQKELLKFKKNLSISPVDSMQHGDTLYAVALDTFLAISDTSEVSPEQFEFTYWYTPAADTTLEDPAEVMDEMSAESDDLEEYADESVEESIEESVTDSAAMDTMAEVVEPEMPTDSAELEIAAEPVSMEPEQVAAIILVEVNVDEMELAKNAFRNSIYTALTGYSEPSADIAEMIIGIAMDSLVANPDIADSIHASLDISESVFTINVHRNIPDFHNKISRENAYFKLNANLSDLSWDTAAVEVVEFVADTLQSRGEFMEWQVVKVATDTFYVNVKESYLRHYDNMNMALYELLTGEFNNVHTYANAVVLRAEELAGIDSLEFSGEQVIEFMSDTMRIFVPEEYLMLYDSTFVTYRDTVVQVDDSTFTGVWERGFIVTTPIEEWDSLIFIYQTESANQAYRFEDADSVRDINIREKADTSLAEKAFMHGDQYIVTFNRDSLAESVNRILGEFEVTDSIVVDSLNVISPEYVVGTEEKPFLAEKDSFGGWVDTLVAKKYTKVPLVSSFDYIEDFNYCTVTGLPYRVTIRNNVNLTVESPIIGEIKTNRYLFFTQVDSSHGRIVDGEPSWKD